MRCRDEEDGGGRRRDEEGAAHLAVQLLLPQPKVAVHDVEGGEEAGQQVALLAHLVQVQVQVQVPPLTMSASGS